MAIERHTVARVREAAGRVAEHYEQLAREHRDAIAEVDAAVRAAADRLRAQRAAAGDEQARHR